MKHLIWMAETSGLTAAKAHRLLSRLESAEAVWKLKADEAARICELNSEEKRQFANKSLARAEDIMGKCKKANIQIMGIFDPAYPGRLKNIYDPPLVLYILGRLPEMFASPSVAIVGHRDATPYGLAAAEKLGYQLSEAGFIVVSGMAKGIDGASHKGALKGQTPTVAVFGTAIDQVYPFENIGLFRQILQSGAVISEYPPGTKAQRWFFPQRNRIISGLCLGTIVVEAGRKSGSLITAGLAVDQGRDVFAVPGSINAASSVGANELIKTGAILISGAQDVIEHYRPLYGFPKAKAADADKTAGPSSIRGAFKAEVKPQRAKTGDPVLDSIGGKTHVDDIVRQADLPEHQVLARLTVLELEGRVRQLAGKFFEVLD